METFAKLQNSILTFLLHLKLNFRRKMLVPTYNVECMEFSDIYDVTILGLYLKRFLDRFGCMPTVICLPARFKASKDQIFDDVHCLVGNTEMLVFVGCSKSMMAVIK